MVMGGGARKGKGGNAGSFMSVRVRTESVCQSLLALSGLKSAAWSSISGDCVFLT